MVDQYYNHMMENLVHELHEMLTLNEPGTMREYKIMNLKEWPRFKQTLDSIRQYSTTSGKKNNLMTYYDEDIYPLVVDGKTIKQGFKKYYGFRIDDYDFRQMLGKIDRLMKLDI